MKPLIKLEDVSKTYGDVEVLKDFSLSIHKGEVVCIVGPSGSGKSTLLKLINGLEAMTQGSIQFNSTENATQDRIGMVFQNFNLFPHLSVLKNLTLAPILVNHENKAVAQENALKLLEKVGLQDKAHQYPNQLSGGQQQRVAIARALALNPELMLFDEPTSALDPELSGEVLKVIRTLADEGMTLVIVTHELTFAKEIADRIVFMEHGRIVEEGRAQQVFENPTHERTRAFVNYTI